MRKSIPIAIGALIVIVIASQYDLPKNAGGDRETRIRAEYEKRFAHAEEEMKKRMEQLRELPTAAVNVGVSKQEIATALEGIFADRVRAKWEEDEKNGPHWALPEINTPDEAKRTRFSYDRELLEYEIDLKYHRRTKR